MDGEAEGGKGMVNGTGKREVGKGMVKGEREGVARILSFSSFFPFFSSSSFFFALSLSSLLLLSSLFFPSYLRPNKLFQN